MGINTVTLSGNVGQDPQIRYFESGTSLAEFTLAVQGFAKGEKKTLWFVCKAFGKPGEFIGEYVKKGNSLTISGSLDIEEWETHAGEKRSKTVVMVNQVQLPPKAE